MKPNITITVKLKVEGLHSFPNAGEIFPAVGYLENLHRHTFHIACEMEVTHTNRDKEFIITKHEIEKYLKDKYYNAFPRFKCCHFGAMSCEDIALDLYKKFELISCTVGEDGEFEAHVTSKNIFNS